MWSEHDSKIFDHSIGHIQSMKRHPQTYNKESVEYLPIGNNVEIDVMGFLRDKNYIFCSLHVRDFKEFKPDSVNMALKQLRHFIIERTSQGEYSKPYNEILQELPDDLGLQIITILFDPGFTGHVKDQEKKGGITLATMGIMFPEKEYKDYAENMYKINLKNLILNPESVYSQFVLHDIDTLNHGLNILSNQQHILPRMNIMADSILQGKQKLSITLGGEQINLPYKWFGPRPHIRLHHSIDGKYRMNGEVDLNFTGSKDECGFEVHVTPELYDIISEDATKWGDFRDTIRKLIKEKFRKFNMDFTWTSHVNLEIKKD